MDSPTGVESLIAVVSNDKEHKNKRTLVNAGVMSVTNGRKVCTGVLCSGEKGLCGSELGWRSTAVTVEQNSRGELSYRRRNEGGERWENQLPGLV